MRVGILRTCRKCIARNKCSARTLCATTNFFRFPSVSQESKRWVHGATMNQHAQACEHMSRSYTRQHAAARSCSALFHRCPSLRLLTCVNNEILSGIGACFRRSVSAVSHISQHQSASALSVSAVSHISQHQSASALM